MSFRERVVLGLLACSTACFAQVNWSAQWIGFGNNVPLEGPLPILRHEFKVDKPLRKAVMRVSGVGQFEARINGARVDDHVLDPGWTNYRKSVLFITEDVTGMLKQGSNTVAALVGNGFYNLPGGRYSKYTGSFGPPRLILQLDVEFSDGSSMRIATDGSWKIAPSPITFSSIYGGEDFDARLEPEGWDRADFNDAGWKHAAVVDPPGGELREQTHPPVRVQHVYQPVRITEPKPGVLVYDLGQNFSGWPAIAVRGTAGTRVRLIPGELLDKDGLVTQQQSGRPVWFEYTLRGSGDELWHPRFSYYGFRYVQVEGVPRSVLHSLTGEFLYSSAEPVGQFRCSKPLFNRIHELILAALRSNLQSVVTDCPHREKLGWLEVPHLMAPSLFYNHDAASLYSKIENDMADAQLDNGLVPDIAPEFVVFNGAFRDSPEWGSAAVIIPWQLRQWYGDTRTLERRYLTMKRYVEYLWSRSEGEVLSYGLGDWYDIGPGSPGPSKLTPLGITATGFLYRDLVIVRDSARMLGYVDDAASFGKRADQVAAAFETRFYRPQTGLYGTGSQTSLALPLVVGLAPPERRARLIDALVADVRAHGNHPTAGDIGHAFLIQALQQAGRSDVIFDMASQEEPPSYGAQLRAGATALTEAWDGDPRSSQNHCMLGHLEEWFYAGLAGIQPDPEAAGFRHFFLRPQAVGDLEWVEASYKSAQGMIKSAWRRNGNEIEYTFDVPAGTTATAVLDGKTIELSPGVAHLRGSVRR